MRTTGNSPTNPRPAPRVQRGARLALAGVLAGLLTACGPGGEPEERAGGRTADELPEELAGGKWSQASNRAPRPSAEHLAILEELNSLGYADGVREAPELVSVTRHDPERAWDGLNLYVSGHATEAYLIDMAGQLVHTWSHDYDALWPELEVPANAAGRDKWRRVHLFDDGELLAIHEGIGMIRLDRDSRLLWEYPGKAHHDMHPLPDGRIWTLTREALIIPRVNPDVPSMDDYLVELSAEGEELRRVSVLESLERGGCDELLALMKRGKELFHTNSIEVLDGRIADRAPGFAAGNLLISLRHLNAIAVVDPEAGAVVWTMTGDFEAQHDPKVLDNGNLMLFDNRGKGSASTVYEFDPATREVVWEYAGTESDPFFSNTCGTAYRLPNGNTLISESDGGRAFELAPDGAIVWEFFNPHRGGEDLEFIACLYDLQRVAPGPDWLE